MEQEFNEICKEGWHKLWIVRLFNKLKQLCLAVWRS